MTQTAIPAYTEAELASLTPDELEAIQGDDGTDDEAAADAPVNELEQAAAEEVVAEAADAEEQAIAAPAYTAQAPADATTQIEAFKQAKTDAKTEDRAALKKMMDGEIDFDEYEAIKTKSEDAVDAANEHIAELKQAISKAQISAEMTQQETARAWNAEISTLMTAGKAEGLDYKGNEALSKELNGLVRAFGQEATEQGMTDDGLKASKWALKQAHDIMKMRHADLLVKPLKLALVPGGPRHALTALNNLPNADRALGDNDTISKFASLEGDDLERAMASMSKAEVEKLMASV